jgi:hypothetical protein
MMATGSKRERGFGSAPTVKLLRTECPECPAHQERCHFATLCRMLLPRMRGQSQLMRVARRESFRETVFLCSTPLVIAR